MPSFKMFIALVTFAAASLTPLATAGNPTMAVRDSGRSLRAARAMGSPFVQRRSASSDEQRASSRAAAAKRAVTRRAARAATASTVFNGIYPTAFAATPESVAAAKVSCTANSDCSGVAVISNSKAVCLAQACRIRCVTGFIPGGTPPTDCVADDDTCTNKATGKIITCPVVTNGWTKCNSHGSACNKKCLKAWQLVANSDGSYTCYDVYHDIANCGSIGTVCPGDYNGLAGASPWCHDKKCTLTCPSGTTVTATSSTEKPYACE